MGRGEWKNNPETDQVLLEEVEGVGGGQRRTERRRRLVDHVLGPQVVVGGGSGGGGVGVGVGGVPGADAGASSSAAAAYSSAGGGVGARQVQGAAGAAHKVHLLRLRVHAERGAVLDLRPKWQHRNVSLTR